MKHFEPLRTYLSPCLTAFVRMPDTSEPASGSVRQNEASFGASDSMPRYFFFVSSEPPSWIGAVARPLHISDVPMPEHPQRISFSAKSCAISRRSFCSFVSVKSTNLDAPLIDSSVNDEDTAAPDVPNPVRCLQHELDYGPYPERERGHREHDEAGLIRV